MEKLKNWGIFLDEISLEGLKIEFEEVKELEDLRIKEPFSGFLKLKKIGIEVKLEGFIKGSVILMCDRCLAEFEYKIEHNFWLDLKPVSFLNFEGERALTEEEMEVSFYENSWISFSDIIKEEVILALPYKKLCRSDCRGICPSCGANLNEGICNCGVNKKESPFVILRDLLKSKEKGE